jgi:hypothetical protein
MDPPVKDKLNPVLDATVSQAGAPVSLYYRTPHKLHVADHRVTALWSPSLCALRRMSFEVSIFL